jgi:hypothetical protein
MYVLSLVSCLYSEPVFVNLLRSPGIESTLFVVLARHATLAGGIECSELIPEAKS